jgi:LuxR family transcriptional regulator, maltose regulon positive regulatory protein
MIRMGDLLVTTKLCVPRVPSNLIARPQLIKELQTTAGRKLTLISAPAGFGKTTLLGEWIARLHCDSGGPFAWVSLDQSDNDLTRFLSYLIAALRIADVEIGEGVAASLRSPEPPRVEAVVGTVVNELAAVAAEVVVVFDDYHTIDEEDVHRAVAFLLEHLPPNVHLVISSRTKPPLPLARLRARGQLAELRAADLRFTLGEAAAFLDKVTGSDLPRQDVAALQERTEGWVAGLQLAALSMRGYDDPSDFVGAFSGSHRHILDYLAEEVLDRQSECVRTFLLSTCVLDRMTGPLCDSLTGRSDGQEMLEELERGNLFLIPLDAERRWFRYHHLFSDFLKDRLERGEPGRVDELHRRASCWYEHHGWAREAIGHALAAEDYERAARLVEEAAGGVWRRGEVATLSGWLQALPEEAKRRPRLLLEHATALMWGGQLEGIEPLLQEAERAVGDAEEGSEKNFSDADGEDRRRLLGRAAAIRSWRARHLVDTRGSIEFARRALDLLPEGDLDLRSFAALCMGAAYWGAAGTANLQAASAAYAESARLGRAAENAHVFLAATQDEARIQMERGRLRIAEGVLREALRFAEERACTSLPATGLVRAAMGELLYERNDLCEAELWLIEGLELTLRTGEIIFSIRGHIALSRAKWALGDTNGALSVAQGAQRLAQESGVGRAVVEASVWKARLHLARGELSSATLEQERATGVGEVAPTAREYERIGLARLLLARDAPEVAARLLEETREDAEAAGRIGNVIGILALEALALWSQGKKDCAIVRLARSLSLAEPEGYTRTFVDQGPPMTVLLSEMLEEQSKAAKEPKKRVSNHYLRKLLAALENAAGKAALPDARLPEPLSEREREVLALVVTGKTNVQVASELFVAPSTIKTHVKNVYKKLGVHNRPQAILRARELELI